MEASKTTWRDGLPWLEDVAAGAVDAGVEAVRLDTWELMGAVAQAMVHPNHARRHRPPHPRAEEG